MQPSPFIDSPLTPPPLGCSLLCLRRFPSSDSMIKSIAIKRARTAPRYVPSASELNYEHVYKCRRVSGGIGAGKSASLVVSIGRIMRFLN
jgi:hypothetical protein